MEGAGIHFFFFGFVDSVYKSQPVFIENPKIQIGKNRLWRKIRTGWDKIQVGQDGLGKGWLVQGLAYSIFFFGFVDFGYKSPQDFIENPKVQIGFFRGSKRRGKKVMLSPTGPKRFLKGPNTEG